MMESLYSFNNLIESANKKPSDEDDEDIFDDDEFIDFDDEDIFDEDFDLLDDEEDDNTPPPPPTQLSDLPNLGASMVKRLGAIDIFTIEELMQA